MPIYYPKATLKLYSSRYPGARINPDKCIWHTTETGGLPGYNKGASAPHNTYDAVNYRMYQHFSLDRSARALRNEAGGVETNTDDAVQIEIVAYSDERLARSRGHLPVSGLNSRNIDELAAYAEFLEEELGVPLVIDDGWLFTKFNNPPMTYAEWRAFKGHAGHNRVPENTHWDPGPFDIEDVIHRAKQNSEGIDPERDEDMPLTAADKEWFRYTIRRAVGAEYANVSAWTETLLPTPGARSRDGLLGYAAGLSYDVRKVVYRTEVTVKAILEAVGKIPGVDINALKTEIESTIKENLQVVDADAVVDEIQQRLAD